MWLEPELKSSRNLRCLSQAYCSKILIKQYWKEEMKSNTSYNDVEKTASIKSKEHLQQERVIYNTYEKKWFPKRFLHKCKMQIIFEKTGNGSLLKLYVLVLWLLLSIVFWFILKAILSFVCSDCITELFQEFSAYFTYCNLWILTSDIGNDKVNNNDVLNFI